jgi:hypothetical protein
MKRQDQSTGILLASRLFYQKDGYKNPQRSLECLQKALKIADSVYDRHLALYLFVSILDTYLVFYSMSNEAVTVKHINSLLEMIATHAELVKNNESEAVPVNGGPLAAPYKARRVPSHTTETYYKALVKIIENEQHTESLALHSEIGATHGFASDAPPGRWASISIPKDAF